MGLLKVKKQRAYIVKFVTVKSFKNTKNIYIKARKTILAFKPSFKVSDITFNFFSHSYICFDKMNMKIITKKKKLSYQKEEKKL